MSTPRHSVAVPNSQVLSYLERLAGTPYFAERPLRVFREGSKKEEEISLMVDARLSFLARAAARWWLVENGEMGLDEAFDGLVDDINERKAIEKHFDEVWRRNREKKLKQWRV